MATPSLKQKLLIGGIGGLAPILAKLLIQDVNTITLWLQNLDFKFLMIRIIGYLLWALILFGAGAFWVFLNKSEKKLLKIFQLGIVAPAMITGMIQSAQMNKLNDKVDNAIKKTGAVESTNKAGNLIGASITSSRTSYLISTAYAANNFTDKKTETNKKQISIWNQLIDGALARPPIENKVQTLVRQSEMKIDQLESKTTVVTNLEATVSKLEGEIEKLNQAKLTVSDDMQKKLQEKITQLEHEVEKSKEEKASIQSKLIEQHEIAKSLENKMAGLKSKMDDVEILEKNLSELKRDLRKKDSLISELQTEYKENIGECPGKLLRTQNALKECLQRIQIKVPQDLNIVK